MNKNENVSFFQFCDRRKVVVSVPSLPTDASRIMNILKDKAKAVNNKSFKASPEIVV